MQPTLSNPFITKEKTRTKNFASIWSPLIRGGRKAGIFFHSKFC